MAEDKNALPESITQKYLRRWPDSKRSRSWAGRMVHIETENGVWRTGGAGYTYAGRPDAWVIPFEEAQRQVKHCGPEKRARFIAAISPVVAAPVEADDLVARLRDGLVAKPMMAGDGMTLDISGSVLLMSKAADRIGTLTAVVDEWKDAVLKQNSNVARNLARAETAEARIAELEAENAQMQDILLKATKFDFGETPNERMISVVSRGPDAWAVSDEFSVLNASGEWEREPRPSMRTDEFIARTRFTFADAVTKARSALSKSEPVK